MERVVSVKRVHGVATLTLSDDTVLKVPSAIYVQRKYREGEFLDVAQYERFIASRAYAAALERAVKLLSLRECSSGEIAGKLRAAGYDEQTRARVMETLLKHQLVCDARFAQLYTLSRSQKHGKRRIFEELKRKGVSRDTAREALDFVTSEDEAHAARTQAKKLLKNKPDTPQTRQKALAAMVRRGFSYYEGKRALDAILSPDEDEQDVEEY